MVDVLSSEDDAMHCISPQTEHPNGTYVLRIKLTENREVVFGRFKKGKTIQMKRGHYIYIGSALGQKGSSSLGNRLRRHTSRSDGNSPHEIQAPMLKLFDSLGISYTKRPSQKKLFWNIDHLLDLDVAEIIGLIFIRNPIPLENTWSEWFESLNDTTTFEKGLGANDSKGHTHVQKSRITDIQWKTIPYQLPDSMVENY